MSASDSSSSERPEIRLADSYIEKHKKEALELLMDDQCALCHNPDSVFKCAECKKQYCSDCEFEEPVNDDRLCVGCGLCESETAIEEKREKINDLEGEIEELENAQETAKERMRATKAARTENELWANKHIPLIAKYLALQEMIKDIKSEMTVLNDKVHCETGIVLDDLKDTEDE